MGSTRTELAMKVCAIVLDASTASEHCKNKYKVKRPE